MSESDQQRGAGGVCERITEFNGVESFGKNVIQTDVYG